MTAKRDGPVFKSLQLSKVFWVAISIVYSYCLLVLYAFSFFLGDVLDPEIAAQYYIALKLTSVRLVIMILGLIAYPLILTWFLKYAKYVTLLLTAWVITMYIEDYFVLYAMVKYPEGGLNALVQSLRPIPIFSLIWICFELTSSPQPRD